MTDIELCNILTSLGYKEASVGKWLKPVGKHLLSFEAETNLWTNWFIDMRGKIAIWDSHEYIEDLWKKEMEAGCFSPLHAFIVHQESWSRYNLALGGDFRV